MRFYIYLSLRCNVMGMRSKHVPDQWIFDTIGCFSKKWISGQIGRFVLDTLR
jgi:hypothetical protein